MSLQSNPVGLYQSPEPLNPKQQGQLRLLNSAAFKFAKHMVSVPLMLSEMVRAASDYPLIFVTDESGQTVPNAVLGTKPGQNKYVNKKGEWRSDCYVPAYLRRYPFVFAKHEDEQSQAQHILCVDAKADVWTTKNDDGQLLFENGELSDTTKRALSFCTAYEKEWVLTKQFVAALTDLSLITSQRIKLSKEDSNNKVLQGLEMIDAEAFSGLSDVDFCLLRGQGYLPAIYAQLASRQLFSRLA